MRAVVLLTVAAGGLPLIGAPALAARPPLLPAASAVAPRLDPSTEPFPSSLPLASPSPTDLAPSPSAGPAEPTASAVPPTATATLTPSATVTPSASPTGTATATPAGSAAPAPSTTEPSEASASPSASASAVPTVVERPASPPAVRTSGIPVSSVVIALAVLVAVAIFLAAAQRRARQEPAPGATPPAPARPEPEGAIAMLVALGEAMIDSGDPVTHIQESLRRVAEASGVEGAGIVVLPTAILVSVPGAETVQTAATPAGLSRLRLDQVDEVFQVVQAAERGEMPPAVALSRLRWVRSRPAPFGPLARTVGYLVLTVGLALILNASVPDLVVAAVLGVAVGAVQLGAARLAGAYQVFVPVLSAFGVSLVVFLVARAGLDVGVLAPLVAPLVMFLPGALLTTSVIELATGQMISGASRLAAGAMQLTLLALGIVAAAQLVGVPAATVGTSAAKPLGVLAPWVGVALFGAGIVVHYCARPHAAGWVMLVLYAAYAGQVLGGLLFGAVLSAFFGALLMTPVAAVAATRRSGPPTLVTFLPAFWLLVPGALGLVGVTRLLGHDSTGGLTALLTTAVTMIAIAFGVLVGTATGATISTVVGRKAASPAR